MWGRKTWGLYFNNNYLIHIHTPICYLYSWYQCIQYKYWQKCFSKPNKSDFFFLIYLILDNLTSFYLKLNIFSILPPVWDLIIINNYLIHIYLFVTYIPGVNAKLHPTRILTKKCFSKPNKTDFIIFYKCIFGSAVFKRKEIGSKCHRHFTC